MPKAKWKVTNLDRTSIQMTDKYQKYYKENTVVKANKGSLGIMVFKTKRQAERWADDRFGNSSMVLKVLPIGKGKVPKLISTPNHINIFYKHLSRLLTQEMPESYSGGNIKYNDEDISIALWPVPPGTICYPAVKVLT